MPSFATVYHKNHPEGLRIYQSELQSWLDDGASLEPLSNPKPKTTRKKATDSVTETEKAPEVKTDLKS